MQHISDIIQRKVRNTKLGEAISTAEIIAEAERYIKETMGNAVRKAIAHMHLKEKTLTIECSHPIASQELAQHKARLLENLKKTCGDLHITNIAIKTK